MGATESKVQEVKETEDAYDVECHIPSLLSAANEGWKIFASENIRKNRQATEAEWDKTRVVAVVGLYNKGKTTVVNMLSGSNPF